MPSILELTGTSTDTPEGKAAIRGASRLSAVAQPDPKRVGPEEPAVLELVGGRAVHKGDWKAVLLTSRLGGLPSDKLPLKHGYFTIWRRIRARSPILRRKTPRSWRADRGL